MTKKQTLTITLPDGSTGTRKTARTYTHAIAIGNTPESQIADLQKDIDRQKGYLAEFQDTEAMEAHYEKMAASFPESYTVEQGRSHTAEQIARVEAFIAEYEALIEEVLADPTDAWSVLSWCGRPDLAQKAYADAVKRGVWDFVEIIEVPQP